MPGNDSPPRLAIVLLQLIASVTFTLHAACAGGAVLAASHTPQTRRLP